MSGLTTGGPLRRVTSLKLKLGLLVAVSVLVATLLATAGAGAVPTVLAVPVTVLVALGVTQLLAVGMVAPLREMTAAARRMAGGDYDVRVTATSTDEVGQLSRAFNTMAADLATVDRQRRDLVATVSHELRTPLAALVAVLENLDDGVTRPEPRTISVALGQARRLSDLVRDLLDLSRVDAGVAPLALGTVAVGTLVAEVVAEVEAGDRGVLVQARVEPPELEVEADPRRLHQLLANLLENAVRHSPEGGTVELWASRTAEGFAFQVGDEGSGVDPEDHDRVFERFGTAGSGGGTGLGLAIARWVADLHGGSLDLVAAPPGRGRGAWFRADIPTPGQAGRPGAAPPGIVGAPFAPSQAPVAPSAAPTPQEYVMTAGMRPMPPVAGTRTGQLVTPSSILDEVFGRAWTDRGVEPRRWALVACLAIGLASGFMLPFDRLGLAASLTLLASGVVVLLASRQRDGFTWACAALCVGFAAVVTLRDAAWIAVLGVMASGLLVTTAVTRARGVVAMVLAALAWPLAGLRGLPWLGRTLQAFGSTRSSLAVLRTVALSVLAVVVFGALFASGDAVVGHWASLVLPPVDGQLVARAFLAVAIAGVVLAAAYLAINPPALPEDRPARAAAHRFEWLAPVLLVDAVFAVFLLAQAAVLFGGHGYVRRHTGLTYAAYVHQGFAQLTLATALTLLVVWAAARKCGPAVRDRVWLRATLGALCVLTLVVVGSALHRVQLYQEAYGFTRLRLLADAFEGWLGLVLLGVVVAGVRLHGAWLPRLALLTGAATLLALALANPDALIAQQNVDRFHRTGRIDYDYLRGLSADAVPVLARLPRDEASCALGDTELTGIRPHTWAGWNLSRARASDILAARGLTVPIDSDACP